LIELMAAGVPVVADAVGQNREYIEADLSGVLVPPGDTDAFVEAVIMLLGDAEVCRLLGQAAQCRIAEHFTWEHLVLNVEEVYRVIMS
jgi:glycosyltransferase involved in cell wall biosynthesis